jgi:outer membrane autotransporter protein
MVFGGYSQAGTATGNTLRIFGTPDLRNSGLVGGRFNWDGMSALQDTRTGNTLEIHTLNLQTSGIDNFQHFRFYLPDTVRAGDTVLTVNNGVVIETPSSGPSTAPTTVGVGIEGGGTPLAVNDTVTLIKSTSFLVADTGMTNTTTGMAGISSLYTFGLETTVNSLLARVTSIEQTDESVRKSPSEGKAAGVALVTQGADLAAGPGMGNARAAAVLGADNMAQAGWAGFGATSGGTSRYATGSHVDVQSFSLMTGLAKRLPVSGADLLVGAFFETSFGSYDSHNETAAGESITAKGDSRSTGGGLLGRVEATEGMARGLYAEATVRAGRLSSDYRSDDLNPALGEAEYDINVAYYGAHAGVGYIWNISEQAWLDLYGKYFWTHTTGADVRILGDPVTFDDVDSYRTRLGARFGYALNKCITPYTGAAWEYEFDGTAHSVVAGVDAPAPTLKGGTGVGEAGIIWKPLPDSGFSLDLGAQGYTGVREGVGGNLSLMYEF